MISALSLGLAPPVSTHQRRHAFERVYAEGRWIAGADGAGCKSGWSDVGAGQGSAALRALESVGRGLCRLLPLPITAHLRH